MIAWRKAQRLHQLMQRKEQRAQQQYQQQKRRLEKLNERHQRCQSLLQENQQQLRDSDLHGVIDRRGLSRKLRGRAILLNQQRNLLLELEQIADQQLAQQQQVVESQRRMVESGKKTHKVALYLQQTRRAELLRCENAIENDTQELAIYVNR